MKSILESNKNQIAYLYDLLDTIEDIEDDIVITVVKKMNGVEQVYVNNVEAFDLKDKNFSSEESKRQALLIAYQS